MSLGQYDNDTDPLVLICLYQIECTGGTNEDEVGFDFGSKIFTLDLDFLAEEGFGCGVG